MNDYVRSYERARRAADNGQQRYMVKVYAHVAWALLMTAGAAALVLTFEPLTRLLFVFDCFGNVMKLTPLGFIVSFVPLLLTFYLRARFMRLSYEQVRFVLALYAALTGLSLSGLAWCYTSISLGYTCLITAVSFAVMSLYGYVTQRDLSGLSSFLTMGIWALVVTALLNCFIGSDLVNFVESFLGVIIFILYVAFQTQTLKRVYDQTQDSASLEKIALLGAFSLYLNFLNLFIYLLRFLGERRRSNN